MGCCSVLEVALTTKLSWQWLDLCVVTKGKKELCCCTLAWPVNMIME